MIKSKNKETNAFDIEKCNIKVVKLGCTDSYQGVDLKTPNSEALNFDGNVDEIFLKSNLFIAHKHVLADKLVEKLTYYGKTISVSESLTGGLVASTIVGVSGVSKVFDFGIVTYSNEAKHNLLGVKNESLEKYGAVSEIVAREMAEGVIKSNDYSISTTGIAGPTGDGICEKVGTVFIGIGTKKGTNVYGFHFEGDRDEIRRQTVQAGLGLALAQVMLDNKE